MGPDAEHLVRQFFGSFYREAIFSSWMLAQPFIGAFAGDALVACGGVVALHDQSSTANLGNFLTHPQHRGKGYAKAVVRTLVHHLLKIGIRRFTLGTNAENIAACRTDRTFDLG